MLPTSIEHVERLVVEEIETCDSSGASVLARVIESYSVLRNDSAE